MLSSDPGSLKKTRMETSVRAKPILAENIIFLGSDVPISQAVTKTSCDFVTNPVILSEKYLQTTHHGISSQTIVKCCYTTQILVPRGFRFDKGGFLREIEIG